jgi:hypothetical protein
VATLSGTHISPVGGLGCALREQWLAMFRDKNADQIKRIQEAFDCCGFRNVRDMPWPFPAKGVSVDTCRQRFDRTVGCEGAWRDKERTVAGLMIAVAVGVFVWVVRNILSFFLSFFLLTISIQAVIIVTPAIHPTWAHESMRLPHRLIEEEDDVDAAAAAAANRVIDYPSQRYIDDPEDQADGDARREITGLNNDSRLALQVESSRDQPSKLLGEQAVWRGESGR